MDVKLIGMELGSKDRKYAKIIGTQLEASPLPHYDIMLGLRVALNRKTLGFKEIPVYIHGSLHYDSDAGLFSIQTFKIDAKSRNFLLDKALEALANKLYYRKILDAASVDVKKLMQPELLMLNQRLKKGLSIAKGTQLGGILEKLSVLAVVAFKDYVRVHVLVSGTLEVTLDELPGIDFN